MKLLAFASRNTKEILRDPLSYIFCLGFPVVMLLVFRIVNAATAYPVTIFTLPYLTPGITVFSFTFVMLYMTLLVSKDRASSFLTRLYCAPMTQADFVLGYLLPGMVIAIGQAVICLLASWLLSVAQNEPISLARGVLMVVAELPAMLLFVSLGILFGSLLSEKSAPGIASIVISASGFVSGAWMPVADMGSFETACRVLPFYPAVCLGRTALQGSAAGFHATGVNLLTICLYAVVILAAAICAFRHTLRHSA